VRTVYGSVRDGLSLLDQAIAQAEGAITEAPVADMLGLLMAGGYPHWISVEWEKRWHPEIAEPQVALPQHLRVLAEWMEMKP